MVIGGMIYFYTHIRLDEIGGVRMQSSKVWDVQRKFEGVRLPALAISLKLCGVRSTSTGSFNFGQFHHIHLWSSFQFQLCWPSEGLATSFPLNFHLIISHFTFLAAGFSKRHVLSKFFRPRRGSIFRNSSRMRSQPELIERLQCEHVWTWSLSWLLASVSSC